MKVDRLVCTLIGHVLTDVTDGRRLDYPNCRFVLLCKRCFTEVGFIKIKPSEPTA